MKQKILSGRIGRHWIFSDNLSAWLGWLVMTSDIMFDPFTLMGHRCWCRSVQGRYRRSCQRHHIAIVPDIAAPAHANANANAEPLLVPP